MLTITTIGNRLQLVDTSGDGGGLAWKIGDVWPEKAMEDVINAVVEFCDEFLRPRGGIIEFDKESASKQLAAISSSMHSSK